MRKLKVMTVVGTRPEIIRLSRVLVTLDRETDHVLVHTGQNFDYELNQVFFEDLGLRTPDHYLDAAGNSPAETIGLVIARIDAVIESVRPDAFLVLGDTNSCLAAIAAKRRKVPVFHMEAGNRCFDQRVPEEINRRIIDHIADINLPYSDIARGYLLREGLPPDRVIKTGSPMAEVLLHYRARIEASDAVGRLGLTAGQYFVVSAHREENIEPPGRLERLLSVLDTVGEVYGLPIIVSTHPRTQKRLEVLGHTSHPLVRFLKPLSFSDYVKLQLCARATLSDSGTISEESAILDFPALNMREVHERPEAMEEAAVMLVGLSPERVLQGLSILAGREHRDHRFFRPVADYSMPNVSDKVLRIVLSYTDYVRRMVWGES
jgi:UDP-N-acetylglucosamine 2-epimerase (non-hydrolysing)